MELSPDTADNLPEQKYQEDKNNAGFVPQYSADILDLSCLNLEDEETWLHKPSQASNINYQDWLYGKVNPAADDHLSDFKLKSIKSIDTRTFTRPKKKPLRPSIIDYQQFHPSATPETIEENQSPKSKEPEFGMKILTKPLSFDLSQPTSLNHFDAMINSSDMFQNMSPPSLVNSLCSSTFANLMENSFIKNDPVLREIRDKDFTETVMLEDIEAPLFQSISESCCSLGSDTPESFLRKVSFNGTCKTSGASKDEIMEDGGEGNEINTTFKVHQDFQEPAPQRADATFITTNLSTGSPASHNGPVLNGTYRRTPKRNATFRKADNMNRLSLNLTYNKPLQMVDNKELSKSIETDIDTYTHGLNTTRITLNKTEIKRIDSVENMKRKYSNMELNRLSYCGDDDEKGNLGEDEFGDKEDNFEGPVERLSLGSAESLDRTSSLSNSSRGSNKVLNLADVDDILAETRGRGLMSTPKVNMGVEKLWENNYLSPIVSNKEVKTNMYSRVSNVNLYIKPTDNKELKVRKYQRPDNTSNQRPLQALNIKGSYSNISNLKTTSANFGGSQPRLSKPPCRNMIRPPSVSNLQTMRANLKGSYTSLRPISANLPVAPPIGSSNLVQVISRTNVKSEGKMSAPTIPVSNLPRPTGIPRPSSRIPGLRQSVRPATSKGINY